MVKTVCLIAAKRLCNKALQIRKEHVGTLLKTTRAVQNLKIKGRDDFGEGCHTVASEPYYYDSAYHPVKRPSAIPIIMVYGSMPYVGMAPNKNGGHIKSAHMTRSKCLC